MCKATAPTEMCHIKLIQRRSVFFDYDLVTETYGHIGKNSYTRNEKAVITSCSCTFLLVLNKVSYTLLAYEG